MINNVVSVIMPARNAAATIADSVRSVLSQPGLGELIVVDDGSTDGTGEIARGMGDGRVRVVAGPRAGISAALNAGVAQAGHPYLARCDADDLFTRDRLARQVAWLEAHPEFVGISGGFASMTAKGRAVADLAADGAAQEVTDELRAGRVMTSLCTWLIRTEAWRAVGGARVWFETAEDVDLQARLAFAGRVWHDPGVVYRYRLHDASITHSRGPELLRFFDDEARRFAVQRGERGSDDLEDGCPPERPMFDEAGGDKVSCPKRQAAGHLIGSAWRAYAAGDRRGAIRFAAAAVRLDPVRIAGWRTLALVAVRGAKRGDGR